MGYGHGNLVSFSFLDVFRSHPLSVCACACVVSVLMHNCLGNMSYLSYQAYRRLLLSAIYFFSMLRQTLYRLKADRAKILSKYCESRLRERQKRPHVKTRFRGLCPTHFSDIYLFTKCKRRNLAVHRSKKVSHSKRYLVS